MAKPYILIIDDDVVITEMLMLHLKDHAQFNVSAAHSGAAGLASIAHRCPDLVILDILMPGIDGVETLKRIKQSHPALPILMMTASWNAEQAKQCLQYGADEYLTKPISYEHLMTFVHHRLCPE